MPKAEHTILIATDLSARSDRPMQRAIVLAEQLHASLIVLHVPGTDAGLSAEQDQRLRKQIEDDFDLSRIDVEIVFEHGRVPDVIAGIAKQRQCDLILTGVARFDSPRDYILGTTVDYLVRKSPAPVLVVKRRASKPYERLLVATDFSGCSAEALRVAAAMFPNAVLRVVHSFHAAWEMFLERESTIDVVRREADRSMKGMLDELPDEIRSRVEGVNDEGLLGNVISEQLRDWGADLLVVGSHGRGGFAHATIGDTAADLLKSAECDVLVVRRPKQILKQS